jgi:DUF4097 and DUF4098 domain-containing protein YvlB
MKMSTKLVLLTGVASLTIGVVGLLSILKNVDFEEGLTTINMEKKVAVANISKLNIETDIAGVNFIPTTSDEITVRYTGTVTKNQEKLATLTAKQDGETWNVAADVSEKKFQVGINLDEIKSWFIEGERRLQLEVSLPAKVYEEICVKTDIGRIDLKDIQADVMKAQADTGRITLDSFIGKQLELETDTGSITVQGTRGDIRLKTDTGSINATVQEVGKSVELQTDTGRIDLNFTTVPASATFDVSTDVGRINFSVPGVQLEEQDRNSVRGTIGTGSTQISVRADTGSIDVKSGR